MSGLFIPKMELPSEEYGKMVVTIYPNGSTAEYVGDVGRDFGIATPCNDVRPVVRGKWIEDWETGCSECSACHDSFLWEDFKGVADWHFCPNCGARMEEN